ncbi:hypothetical protein FEM48_Zijuj03G0197800 [Ziziphus jujuba var. spinosa]|uniref:Uncharacterized protein n=1 Tax=Ziziphus jujuba var. spinosa TaxID=714518 RepID=A0A978VS97_ZIZJJ|nr:hypothetical protein FEM48_Zijuj03G0197800 [Ziziphus jujuba var. spinosa]
MSVVILLFGNITWAYRALYLLNWIYLFFTELHRIRWIHKFFLYHPQVISRMLLTNGSFLNAAETHHGFQYWFGLFFMLTSSTTILRVGESRRS